MTKTACQSTEIVSSSPDKETFKAGAESSEIVESFIDATPAISDELHPEPICAFQVVEVALREYCFVKDTSFIEREGLHELETRSALH